MMIVSSTTIELAENAKASSSVRTIGSGTMPNSSAWPVASNAGG